MPALQNNPLGLITGYPGWLTTRLLESLRDPDATDPWQKNLAPYRWRALIAPGVDSGPLPYIDQLALRTEAVDLAVGVDSRRPDFEPQPQFITSP